MKQKHRIQIEIVSLIGVILLMGGAVSLIVGMIIINIFIIIGGLIAIYISYSLYKLLKKCKWED